MDYILLNISMPIFNYQLKQILFLNIIHHYMFIRLKIRPFLHLNVIIHLNFYIKTFYFPLYQFSYSISYFFQYLFHFIKFIIYV